LVSTIPNASPILVPRFARQADLKVRLYEYRPLNL